MQCTQLPKWHKPETCLLKSLRQRCIARPLSRGRKTCVSSEEGFIFGSKGYVAGIPTSPSTTECGQRLRACLKHRSYSCCLAMLSVHADSHYVHRTLPGEAHGQGLEC